MGKVNQASADTCHSGSLSAQPLGLYQPSSRTPCQPWVHHNPHTAGPRSQPILMTLYGRLVPILVTLRSVRLTGY